MSKKLTVIVPCRNRDEHLSVFVNEVPLFLASKNLNFDILVVEQTHEKPFNKAKLLNVGFTYKRDVSDYFCFNDIDMIPIDADYSYPEKPYHIATKIEQFSWSHAYTDYYGGVHIINKEDFISINGFSNNYWGWGGEDDDMGKRIEKAGWGVCRRDGTFKSLQHQFNGPYHEHYQNNVDLLGSNYDYFTDGLNTLNNYEIVEVQQLTDKIEKIKIKFQ